MLVKRSLDLESVRSFAKKKNTCITCYLYMKNVILSVKATDPKVLAYVIRNTKREYIT